MPSLTQWGPISCAPIEWGTHQHHDGWCTQCRSLGLAPPAADMQTITTQGCSGMSERFEWWTWSLAVYLPGAATLECCHLQQTCPQTTTDRSEPQQCAAESVTTNIHVPTTALVLPSSPSNTTEPPSDITMVINLQLQGALGWLQQASPTIPAPVSQCSTPRRELPLVPLGAPPPTRETKDPLWPEGMDSAIPVLMATLTQTSPWVATLGNTPSFICVTHPLLQFTMPKTPEG